MSVETTSARIAQMWRNLSADTSYSNIHIEKVFDSIPLVVLTAHLPAVIIFPGEATYDYEEFGEDMIAETRAYRSVLLLASAVAANYEEVGQLQLAPYFAAAKAYFAARPGLEDDSQADTPGNRQDVVYEAHITGDRGYVPFQWANGSDPNGPGGGLGLFHAVEFTHTTTEIDSITYQD